VNWDQLKAILWLRWRLSRNRLVRGGQLNAALSVILLVVMLLAGAGLGVGGVVLGVFVGAKAPPVQLLVWDIVIVGFLVFWLSGLMVEIQRSESIDITKLLHLPVTLSQVFLFNYAASHFTPSIVVLVPGMLGLCAGLTLGAGPAMALLVPLVVSFLFMVTAWTYCLRGWLAALMINKRRRRAVIVWITVIFILLGQVPNLVFNSRRFIRNRRSNQEQRQPQTPAATKRGEFNLPEVVVQAHLAVPPGWIGYGAMGLRQHNILPALCATAVSCLIGALGLKRAYRMTIRFYQDAGGRAKPRPASRPEPGPRRRLLVERRLPWLPDDTAALTLATFRSLTRAPELKMALIIPLVVGVMLASARLARPRSTLPDALVAFAATGAVAVAALLVAPTMANAFGLDRSGFRSLVLLPTRRHHILLAKNLASFPFAALAAGALLILARLLARMSWGVVLTAFLQMPTAFLLFSLTCNLAAMLAPYRLALGTLQAKKPKAVVFVAGLAFTLSLPIVLLPVFIPPGLQLLFSSQGWLPWLPVNLLAAAGILAGAAWLYCRLLPAQGRLLQRREQAILREVTEEVE
jgi:ABC-2 type transport system permease protein